VTCVWKSTVEIVGHFAVIRLYYFVASLVLSLTWGLVRFEAEMKILKLLQFIALSKFKLGN